MSCPLERTGANRRANRRANPPKKRNQHSRSDCAGFAMSATYAT